METHTGLINFLKNNETEKVYLGNIKTETNASVLIDIYRENEEIKISVSDTDDENIIYLTFEYQDKNNFEENLKMISDDFDEILNVIHTKIIACIHCSNIFSEDNDNITGFKDKRLCCDCGLQNLYDAKFSEDKCSICLDNIGFGDFTTICGDIKHKLHLGCGSNLSLCPLCRKSDQGEISFVLNSYTQ